LYFLTALMDKAEIFQALLSQFSLLAEFSIGKVLVNDRDTQTRQTSTLRTNRKCVSVLIQKVVV
jgi:hypothetical protein